MLSNTFTLDTFKSEKKSECIARTFKPYNKILIGIQIFKDKNNNHNGYSDYDSVKSIFSSVFDLLGTNFQSN